MDRWTTINNLRYIAGWFVKNAFVNCAYRDVLDLNQQLSTVLPDKFRFLWLSGSRNFQPFVESTFNQCYWFLMVVLLLLALPVVVGQLTTMLSPPPPDLVSVWVRHNHHQMQPHRTMVRRPINLIVALGGGAVAVLHFALNLIVQVMDHLFLLQAKWVWKIH